MLTIKEFLLWCLAIIIGIPCITIYGIVWIGVVLITWIYEIIEYLVKLLEDKFL